MAALALLGSYLVAKRRQRARERARQPRDESRMTGTAFDAGAVWPRIQLLRKDYVAQIHSRPRATSRRELVLASFRNAVRQLSYFRNATVPEHDSPDYERRTDNP